MQQLVFLGLPPPLFSLLSPPTDLPAFRTLGCHWETFLFVSRPSHDISSPHTHPNGLPAYRTIGPLEAQKVSPTSKVPLFVEVLLWPLSEILVKVGLSRDGIS